MENNKGPILHVLVVGFHHKKGCQVEYSYPSLVPGHANECPLGWKYLPTLALPDGSHNYDADTAFFHLPSLTNPKKTIFGISCFRQIPVEKLRNRTDDITRGTVQKSVCVLSSLPLYGHIEVKMSLITHAYFDEGDFSKVSLLEDTYHHLNACLTQNHSPHQNFVGLSARDFILQWRHKAVLLYKLMLLERKIIFFKSPVQPLCTTILTLLSLHPGMIEDGLEQSACIKLSRPMSPMPDFDDDQYDNIASTNRNSENIPTLVNGSHFISSSNNNLTQLQPLGTSENNIETVDLSNQIVENHFDVHRTSEDSEEKIENNNKTQVVIVENHIQHVTNDDRLETNEDMLDTCHNINKQKTNECRFDIVENTTNKTIDSRPDSIENTNKTNEHRPETVENVNKTNECRSDSIENTNKTIEHPSETLEYNTKTIEHRSDSIENTNKTIEHRSDSFEYNKKTIEYRSDSIEKTIEHRSDSFENTNETSELGDNLETIELSTTPTDDKKTNDTSPSPVPNFPAFPLLPLSSLGLPLPIFTSGYLCLPYLSLPYIDFLADPAVRGYLLGATNVLFKQKPRLGDVLVELDTQRVELLAGGDQDQDLRKAMHLTTEDLRFADYVVKNVQEQRDVFLDGVGYEGGEEWIREQFKGYLMCLLRTSLLQDGCREMEHFNSTFISLWKDTHNYKSWMMTPHPGILELNPGHPFAGQLSVADMKLRLSHTMQNTEGGRKLNQAVMSTGRAVGGAISQARGAITNWWSNLLVSPEGREIDIPQKE